MARALSVGEYGIGADYRSKEGRAALARMITKLFDLWQLSSDEQADMLGISGNSRMTLSRYRKGSPIEDRRDTLDRVGHLLAIYRSLRILWPHNPEIQNNWMKVSRKDFDGKAGVELVKRDGMLGLLIIRRYLDARRGS